MDSWDNPHNPYRRFRRNDFASWLDTMQVCMNGHQITNFAQSQPESRKKGCPDCGAETLMACPKCEMPIPGHHHNPGVLSIGIDPVPAFCENCREPYPWTVKKTKQGSNPAIAAVDSSSELEAFYRPLRQKPDKRETERDGLPYKVRSSVAAMELADFSPKLCGRI